LTDTTVFWAIFIALPFMDKVRIIPLTAAKTFRASL
jgi:hypothetical protein